ncbi:MAG: 2,3,4,5-tetrahydropyridine-2,6-dicarboxylate N-succinyltransferase [Phycisphaerae bacterium]|nr:2,3,4,5-tetrahydropyridine-2,6-dicarboxylate N-succinyltransferase [Phycisphaerae bacterium]
MSIPQTREECIALLDALENGTLRAAEPDAAGGWKVNRDVKEGILQVFRLSRLEPMAAGAFAYRDRDLLFPPSACPPGVRVVPGGTAIRRGAYVAPDVVIMPPAYVNVGAHVDGGTLIDSHALVGSCAQVGRNVHVSAAAQVGGVLEPIGALPVIVEDDAFLGGNCGVYEGVRIGREAVLAAGVVLAASTPVYDLVHGRIIRAVEGVLVIPAGAVVVSGARTASGAFAESHGLSIAAAIIVKYRDSRTDARTALESALRPTPLNG